MATPLPFQLQRLYHLSSEQLDELHRLCRQAPAYWRMTEGLPPNREQVASWLSVDSLPSGCSAQQRHAFAVFQGDDWIGYAELLQGWRYPEQCMIGLLLLGEPWQGRGLGRLLYAELERRIRLWPGMRSVRLAVIASNAPALAFWQKMGFRRTGETRRDPKFLADALLLEKTLA